MLRHVYEAQIFPHKGEVGIVAFIGLMITLVIYMLPETIRELMLSYQ